uniref:Si:dkey-19b23.8 n=1 Tax=Erpetoichthys calabaricus TaxID=27687 RepID=A0A8C4SDW6_ERPCA
MALSSFRLMRTLRNSPAALRRKFSKDRTESLSHGDPLFKVHYLGMEKIYSLQVDQAEEAITRLLEGLPDKMAKDHALVVRPRYLEVKEIATGRQLTKTYLHDIAYCAADTTRPNIFLYICKNRGQQLQCRVFWCSKAKRAKAITACLAQSFEKALSDWQETVLAEKNEVEAVVKVEASGKVSKEERSPSVASSIQRGQFMQNMIGTLFPQAQQIKFNYVTSNLTRVIRNYLFYAKCSAFKAPFCF